jgi:hypothetical protein
MMLEFQQDWILKMNCWLVSWVSGKHIEAEADAIINLVWFWFW